MGGSKFKEKEKNIKGPTGQHGAMIYQMHMTNIS